MPSLLARYATPLTTGLFLVSLVSGIALFFHLGQSAFHGMHEWLSMVLIAPFILHVWKNWRSFLNYFRHPPMAAALGLSLAAGFAFAAPALMSSETGRNGPPQFAVLETLGKATLATVAPVFGLDGEGLAGRLRDAGFIVDDLSVSLEEVAEKSGKSSRDLYIALAALNR